MEITKKDFEQILDEKLGEQSKELKDHSERVAGKLQEELALMIATSVVEPMNERFDELEKKLDVREQMKIFEEKFKKLEEALHIKL